MQKPLLFELGAIALPLALAALLLGLGAAPIWVWPLVLLPYGLRHLLHLWRLARLVHRRRRLVPPFPRGLWGDIYRNIAQYQQRDRKRRKRQIRFSRRFREASDAVPDALVILDKLQRIEWANPAAGQLLDIHWPGDGGRLLGDLLPHPELGAFIEAGEYAKPLELAPEHNRATVLSLRIAPFGERKRQRLVVARDITKLHHLNMIRRDFVANASHELRTPLTVIAGFLEGLADSPATPQPHRRPLTLMQSQTGRMGSIIEDLLTLSRLEMAESTAEQGPVDVADELETILHEARILSAGRHRFELKLDDDLLLLGSQAELRSALSNLVHNAVRHTPEGTCIRICWESGEDGPVFAVEDDGDGIAPEHLPRLTERFYRVDRGRSRESGGTGLGLAIVKHVLNRHDARLAIASSVGQGARFACVFPAGRGQRRSERECRRPVGEAVPGVSNSD
jgi:two-component system, OmpR family, phosphate regulon sensor histidine kinase PhoR